MYLFLTFCFSLIQGVICLNLAKKKARDPNTWFFLGAFLGVLALLILLVIPKKVVSKEFYPPFFLSSDHAKKLWFYLNDKDETIGPMSFDKLKNLYKEKKIFSSTYLWQEELPEWKRLEEFFTN